MSNMSTQLRSSASVTRKEKRQLSVCTHQRSAGVESLLNHRPPSTFSIAPRAQQLRPSKRTCDTLPVATGTSPAPSMPAVGTSPLVSSGFTTREPTAEFYAETKYTGIQIESGDEKIYRYDTMSAIHIVIPNSRVPRTRCSEAHHGDLPRVHPRTCSP